MRRIVAHAPIAACPEAIIDVETSATDAVEATIDALWATRPTERLARLRDAERAAIELRAHLVALREAKLVATPLFEAVGSATERLVSRLRGHVSELRQRKVA